MGCLQTKTEEAAVNQQISNELKKEKSKAAQEIKLLLLGAGESGKSTIFKQMKIIHENGFKDQAENMKYKEVVCGNTISSIRVLITQSKKLGIAIEEQNAMRADAIMAIPEQQIIINAVSLMTPELGRDIKTLWADSGIRKVYERRSEFQLNDSAEYFFKEMDRISAPTYSPSQQDVLRSRMRTVGIVEADYMIEGFKFKMVDVGGQRNERRKWIHVFDDVTAIIFVTSLSEYDQKLFEDDSMNRMKESLLLFEEICNLRYFKNTSIIIFFNKRDLFEDKIKRVDLSICFPDYTGGKSYDAGTEFIIGKFLEVNKVDAREIYTHVTCATDTENIRVVFDAVTNILLQNALKNANLI